MEKEVDKAVLESALEKFERALGGDPVSFTPDESYALGAYFEAPGEEGHDEVVNHEA